MTRTARERVPQPPPHWSDTAGERSLVLGLIAVCCAFIPVIGDWITLPFAAGALALGFIGLRRHRAGHPWRSVMATIGILLGAGAAAAVVVLLLATGHVG